MTHDLRNNRSSLISSGGFRHQAQTQAKEGQDRETIHEAGHSDGAWRIIQFARAIWVPSIFLPSWHFPFQCEAAFPSGLTRAAFSGKPARWAKCGGRDVYFNERT
jgi:hypothetical protein